MVWHCCDGTAFYFCDKRCFQASKENPYYSVPVFYHTPVSCLFTSGKINDSSSLSLGNVQISQQSDSDAVDDSSSDFSDGEEDDSGTDDTADEEEESDNINEEDAEQNESGDINTDPSMTGTAETNSDEADSKLELKGNTVVVNDEDFVGWLGEIYENMSLYKGKRIQIKGFVFKSKQLEQNEFVPARLMMTCCVADLQPVGFLCRYNGAAELKQDAWVNVTGVIKIVDYEGQKTPVIYADSITNADKPKDEYVYPY